MSVSSNAIALELFGLDIEKSRQIELRNAAKQAGVKLIRESGDDIWFDSYDSSAVLPLSRRLYLGFVKQDKRFAFAEYEFVGFGHAQILRSLNQKYGPPEIINGTYISDRKYRWNLDGIEIELNIDWSNFRTRLTYIEPEAFAALKKEQSAERNKPMQQKSTTAFSMY